MFPDNKADNADIIGIYLFDLNTDWGTQGIDVNGFGVVLCWGTDGISGQDAAWCWQRCYFTSSFAGAYRTRTNANPWSDWIKI